MEKVTNFVCALQEQFCEILTAPTAVRCPAVPGLSGVTPAAAASLGQLTNANRFWSNSTARVLGQQFEYTFDDIGNCKTAVSGGDTNGERQTDAALQREQLESIHQPNGFQLSGYHRHGIDQCVRYRQPRDHDELAAG